MSKKERQRAAALPEPAHSSGLVKFIKVCVYLALMTPLLLPSGVDNYTFIKTVSFQTMVTFAFVAWLILAWGDRRYRPDWKNPVVIGVFVYIAALLVTLPFSLTPYRSFWSTYVRMTSTVNQLHFAAWFLVLASVFRGRPGTDRPTAWDAWEPILKWTTLVALIVDGIGLLMWVQNPDQRIISTIGNALYLGCYLVAHFFIALALAARSRHNGARAAYIAVAILHALVIFSSASRSSVLAMAAGLIMGAVYLIAARLKGKRKLIFSVATLGIVVGLSGSIIWLRTARMQPWAESHLPFFARRLVLMDFGADRRSLWAIALQAIKEKPVFGWGMENYGIAFNKYYEPAGRDIVLGEPWYDRAHNQYLDVFVANGIIGFAAYMYLILAVIWGVWRGTRDLETPEERAAVVVMGISFVVLAIELGSMFDVIMSAVFWYFLVAFAAAASHRPTEPQPDLPPAKPMPVMLAQLLLILSVILVLQIDWFPFFDMRTAVKTYYVGISNTEDAYKYAKQALATYRYTTPDIRQNVSEIARNQMSLAADPNLRERIRPFADMMVAEMDKQVADRPMDYKVPLMAAYAWRAYSVYDTNRGLNRAEELAKMAIALDPQRSEAYEELVEIDLLRGNLDQALADNEEAKKRSGNLGYLGRISYREAIVWALRGDCGKALDLFGAWKDRYDFLRDTRLVMPIAACVQKGPNEAARAYVDAVIGTQAHDANAIKAWAIVHWKTGDVDGAEQVIKSLESNYPSIAAEIRAQLK